MPSNCDFSSQLDQIKDLIAAAPIPDTSALEEKIAALELRIATLERDGAKLSDLALFAAQLALQKATADRALSIAQGVPLQLEALKRTTQTLSGQLGQVRAAADRASEIALSTRNTTVPNLRRQLELQERTLSGRIAQNAGKIAGILSALAGLAGLGLAIANRQAIGRLRDVMQSLTQRLAKAEDGLKQNTLDIKGLRGQLNNVKDFLRQLQKNFESQLSKLQNTIANQIKELKSSFSKQLAAILAAIAALGIASRTQFGDIVNSLRNQVQNLSTRTQSLQNQLKETNTRVGGQDRVIRDVSRNLERLRNQFRDLMRSIRGRLGQLAGQIAGLAAIIAGLRNLINKLQNRKMSCNWSRGEINQTVRGIKEQNKILLAMQALVNATIVPATLLIKKLSQSIHAMLKGKVLPGLEVITNIVTLTSEAVKNGFKWLVSDRIIGIANLIGTIHNATFLSRDIFESLTSTADTVLSIMGKELKDSENNPISVGELINSRIRRALRRLLGSKNYATLVTKWTRFSTIYTAGANVLGNLRSIQDSIISGVEIAASNSAKVGNALMKYGVIGDRAFNWLSESPNFDNPVITQLEQFSEKADAMNSIVSETKSVQDEAKDLAENENILRARLRSKDPENHQSWNEDDGVKEQLEDQAEDATQFSDVSFEDIEEP